jgi:hypothetical protein
MAQTHCPRPLTESIAKLLQAKLGSPDAVGRVPDAA